MTETKSPSSHPAPSRGLTQARQDARSFAGNQEQSSSWKPLHASAPVSFMELRSRMCRWPIGDPHDFDTFRFCGCKCSPEAIYCESHEKLAFAPNRSRANPQIGTLPRISTKVA
jgi:hypothetical protein